MRARPIIPVALLAIACISIGVWRSTGRYVRIHSHLSSLAYWERIQSGRNVWTGLFRPQAWRGCLVAAPSRDPLQEIEREYDALVSLGYMTNCSFVLAASLTNTGDLTSLAQRVRGAKLTVPHWQFSLRSNIVDAVVSVADVSAWEQLIRTWEAERIGINTRRLTE